MGWDLCHDFSDYIEATETFSYALCATCLVAKGLFDITEYYDSNEHVVTKQVFDRDHHNHILGAVGYVTADNDNEVYFYSKKSGRSYRLANNKTSIDRHEITWRKWNPHLYCSKCDLIFKSVYVCMCERTGASGILCTTCHRFTEYWPDEKELCKCTRAFKKVPNYNIPPKPIVALFESHFYEQLTHSYCSNCYEFVPEQEIKDAPGFGTPSELHNDCRPSTMVHLYHYTKHHSDLGDVVSGYKTINIDKLVSFYGLSTDNVASRCTQMELDIQGLKDELRRLQEVVNKNLKMKNFKNGKL